MPVRLLITTTGWEKAKTQMRRLDRMLKADTDQYALAGLRGAAKVFADNYRSEGTMVGGWEPLKASTRREREEMGLGGAHPILCRYEDLRVMTTTQLTTVRGSASFAATDFEGGSIKVVVAPKRGAVNVTASGSKAAHQTGLGDRLPARPYWFANAQVAAAAKKQAVFEIAKDIKRL